MKSIVSAALATMLLGSFAFAAQNEDSEKATETTHKNVLTGSHTKTKKFNKKMKDAQGNNMDMKVTDKTTTHKDGTVDHKVDASGETTEKPQ